MNKIQNKPKNLNFKGNFHIVGEYSNRKQVLSLTASSLRTLTAFAVQDLMDLQPANHEIRWTHSHLQPLAESHNADNRIGSQQKMIHWIIFCFSCTRGWKLQWNVQCTLSVDQLMDVYIDMPTNTQLYSSVLHLKHSQNILFTQKMLVN